jgi:hypothetical protein
MPEKRENLELANELFSFLQGKIPDGYKLADDDIEEFHAEAKKIVSKYYELED